MGLKKIKRSLKENPPRKRHKDLFLDNKIINIIFFGLTVFAKSCFRNWSVFSDLHSEKIFENLLEIFLRLRTP